MTTTGSPPPAPFHALEDVAAAAFLVLDRRGTVIAWSPAAEEFLGYRAHEILGRSAWLLQESGTPVPAAPLSDRAGTHTLRRPDGSTLRAAIQTHPLIFSGSDTMRLLMFGSAERLERQAADQAMLRGLFQQSSIGLTVYDAEGRITWVNEAVEVDPRIPRDEWLGHFVGKVLPQGELLSPTGHGTWKT
ncbi:PAS domain-containing protein [Streptomyces fuscichromogenes]|uniref:PAS domain-containing protein n=1 Tax=Streptomyces fuscichromogenes TaxID=1324013 RepID=UPI003825389F